MVVYKALNMYEGWASDGIPGAVYAASSSGWFDMGTFERWYFEIFLPRVKDLEGPKVLIGDNLKSHFSPNVIASCLEHNIRFVTLVPHSTHLCQPLDVAVFRPLKIWWRARLEQWRRETRSIGTIPKEVFPRLLAQVLPHMKSENLISGFKASGIVPLDANPVLKQLVGNHDASESNIVGPDMLVLLNAACLSLLEDYMGIGSRTGKAKAGPRGKKVKTIPGKPVGGTGAAGTTSRPATDDLDSTSDVWICEYSPCRKEWVKGDDNRWIVCDNCDRTYHLQCSGIQYKQKKYYDVDIKNMRFWCEECDSEE